MGISLFDKAFSVEVVGTREALSSGYEWLLGDSSWFIMLAFKTDVVVCSIVFFSAVKSASVTPSSISSSLSFYSILGYQKDEQS